jgi:hypothetical protein
MHVVGRGKQANGRLFASSLFHDLTAHHQLGHRLVSFQPITIAELSYHYPIEHTLVFICLRAAQRWVAH